MGGHRVGEGGSAGRGPTFGPVLTHGAELPLLLDLGQNPVVEGLLLWGRRGEAALRHLRTSNQITSLFTGVDDVEWAEQFADSGLTTDIFVNKTESKKRIIQISDQFPVNHQKCWQEKVSDQTPPTYSVYRILSFSVERLNVKVTFMDVF